MDGGGDISGTACFNTCAGNVVPGQNGCISDDPKFINAAVGNYRLQPDSPCIDAGNNTHVALSTDLDGNPRIMNGVVDMGAYEHIPVPEISVFGSHTTLQNSVYGFESGDLSKLPWELSGSADWFITGSNAHTGSFSVQSGGIAGSHTTSLEIAIECFAGNISFWRMVSSESNFDFLRFYIDGIQQEWQQHH